MPAMERRVRIVGLRPARIVALAEEPTGRSIARAALGLNPNRFPSVSAGGKSSERMRVNTQSPGPLTTASLLNPSFWLVRHERV